VSVAENLARLRADVPAGVTLVAVSKTQPPEAIREAYAAGQRHFGENYAQEWRAKADALADLPELVWHFIGALQTNKVKYLAGRVGFVHTVHRAELARELAK
jgi:PLP dependent protein